MTDSDLIDSHVANGRPVRTSTSRQTPFPNTFEECREHWYRVVLCDGDRDVVECWHCGDQKITRCCFDEDTA